MTYSQETTTTAKNYNIDEVTVLFCQLIAAGADIGDAYHVTHGRKILHHETATAKGRDLLNSCPGAKVLIQRYKNRRTINTPEARAEVIEETEEENNNKLRVNLETREGVIGFLKKNLVRTTGKEAITGAQTLAKLEGYDRPDDKPEEERRHFYLPYVSDCRRCPLSRVFSELPK